MGYSLDCRVEAVVQEGRPFAAIYEEDLMSVVVKPHGVVDMDSPSARRVAGVQARKLRDSLGLSRRQVAEGIQMSEGRIYELERGNVSLDNPIFDKLAKFYASDRAPTPAVITKKNCKRCGSSRDYSDFANTESFCTTCEESIVNQTKRNPMDDPGATLPMMGQVAAAIVGSHPPTKHEIIPETTTPPPAAPMSRESIIEWLGQQLKDERTLTATQAKRIEALEAIVEVTQEELGMFQEENQALEARIKELEAPKAPAVSSTEAALLSSLGCPGFGS